MIYLDNAATTKPYRECIELMNDYQFDKYYNPSAIYGEAIKVLRDVEKAEKNILDLIGADKTDGDKLIFTSGATEANNHAIKGYLRANRQFGRHFIISTIEHHSIMKVAKKMCEEGFELTVISPDKYGRINPEDIVKAIRPDTILISVMTANNEIGTIQDIENIVKAIRLNSDGRYIAFHTDAVQALGHIEFNVKKTDIDMFSASAHKFGGPKGTGLLYVSHNVNLLPLLEGGEQQESMRPGTINAPGIMGMHKALEMSLKNISANYAKVLLLRKTLMNTLEKKCEGIHVNATLESEKDVALPYILSIRFDGVDAQRLVSMLDHDGVMVGIGAACTADDDTVSHVLKAIGLRLTEAKSTIRISFSPDNTIEEINEAAEIIVNRVKIIRKMLN